MAISAVPVVHYHRTMHGRNRIEYEAKVSNADFTKALTKKVINYTALVKACNARKAKKVSDNETLKLTGACGRNRNSL